ncbi:MAG: RNA polymerase sigma factor region1.1 domain-containing protein, partial [bacterium]|nr:RNA polymerase sigma factor region1.1 domain-containing protein [bacterium]
MDYWLESDELRALIESGRQSGYVTIESLLAIIPETELTPDAIEAVLEQIELQGVRVLNEADVSERELRQVSESAERFIE